MRTRPLLATIAAASLIPLLASTGCAKNRCDEVAALEGEADVLFIGDSIFAWAAEECRSVADHTALARGAPVQSRAVNGTQILGGIPGQLVEGDWTAVLVDGGGNDLNSRCECGVCDEVLDAIVSADGSAGATVDLIDEVVAMSAEPVLLRYYVLKEGALWGFDRCDEVFVELGDRYTALADARDEVTLVDLRDVISPETTPGAYDFDGVHPSDEGAAIAGAHIADVLAGL
jgi:hypothetical protein